MVDETPAHPRSRWHRALRYVLFAGTALVILSLVGVVAAQSSWARRAVLARATTWLAAQGITFSADSIDYRLMPLTVSAHNLHLVFPLDTGQATARIGDIALDIDTFALFRGRYVLEEGFAKEVLLQYAVTRPAATSPAPPSEARGPSSGIPANILIDRFEATNLRVQYDDRLRGLAAVLPVARVTIDGDPLTNAHEIALQASDGVVEQSAPSRRVTIDRLTARASVQANRAVISAVDLQAADSTLSASGTVDDFASPRLNLAVRGQLDIARVAELAAVADVGGALQVDAQVEGPLDGITASARIAGRELSYRSLSQAALDVRAAYAANTQEVQIDSLAVTAPWARVEANGRIALADSGQSRLTAEANDVDAGTIAAALVPAAAVATRIDATLSAEWPGTNVRAAIGEMTAQLEPTPSRSPRAIPVGGHLRVDAVRNTITADVRDLRTPGIDARGRVRLVDQRQLSGGVAVQATDIPLVARTAERALGRPAGSLLSVPVSGGVRANARLSGTLASPVVAAEVTTPALQIASVSGIQTAARATYGNDRVEVHGVDIVWAESQAHAQGMVSLGDTIALDLTFNADDVQLKSVAAALARPQSPVRGEVSLSGQVHGPIDRPSATVAMVASDLVAYEEPLGTLTVNASLAEQRLTIEPLRLDKPQDEGQGTLSASGSYSLDDRSYSFTLQSDDLRLEHAALPGGTPLRGELALRANGNGSLDVPVAAVTARLGDVTLGARELGDFELNADVRAGEASIDATSDRFSVDATARVGVKAPYPATVDAQIDGLDLSALPVTLPVPVIGSLRATMTGAGDLTEVTTATATVTLDAFEGSVNGQPVRLPSPAQATYADERIRIDSMQVEASGSTLSVSGDLPLNANATPGAIALDARLDLWSLPMYLPSLNELSSFGVATVTGQVSGTLQALDPDLTLRVDNGMVQTWSMNAAVHDVTLMGRVVDGLATIDTLSATFGDEGQLTASGRVPLATLGAPVPLPPSGGNIAAELHATAIDPRMFPGSPEALHGTLAVDAGISASQPSLLALTGSIEMPTLEIAVDELGFAATQPVRITLENGLARIEQFALTGSVGHLDISGTAALSGTALNVDVDGEMNLAIISAFSPSIRSEGNVALTFAARGSAQTPDLRGSVTIADATVGIDEPQIAAEHLAVRLSLEGARATLTQLSGQLNGGDLSGAGEIVLGGEVPTVDLQLSATDVALSTPLDMRSVSDTHLHAHTDGDLIAVDGDISIKEAGLTGDINFDTGLLAAINARRTLDLTEERSPLLERVRFNVNVDTDQPIVIDNNIARAEVSSDLRVLGTPYEVGLSGRLTLAEGSVITLTEHQYEVERGAITFLGERRIQPAFDLQLTTTASNYNITLLVSGQPGQTDTTLTSIPSLPEPDIMALLVTGRTLDEMRGEEFTVAREQVMSYLAGRLGSQLGQGIEQVTGLSEVRIEPNLIANEVDPAARLTIGQDLGDDLKLVYSTNLSDSNDQVWVLTYDLNRRFRTRAVRQSDGSYRADFRHDVRFGGTPEPRRQKRLRPPILAIDVPQNGPIPRDELQRLLDIEPGDAFDFLDVRDGVDRINRRLLDEGYLQSRVSTGRETTAEGVRISIAISPGPHVELGFTGMELPSGLRRDLRDQWQRGVVDSQRLDDGVETIREWLLEERYMNPSIHGRIDDRGPDQRRVIYDINRGTRFTTMDIVFDGAERVAATDLVQIVRDQDQELKLYTDAAVVVALLERYYHEQGFLTADIHTPRYEYEGTRARVILDVSEGPRYTTRTITMRGNTVFADDRLIGDIPLLADDTYRPAVAERSLERLRDLYWQRGYNDVVADYVLTLDRSAGGVDVAFSVDEGAQVIVSDILVAGNEQTRDSLVRGQLQVTAGEPLDLSALAQSRKNLYDTGAYSLVEVEQKDAEAPNQDASAAGGGGNAGTGQSSGAGSGAGRPETTAPAPPQAGDQAGAADTAPPAKPTDLDVTVREVQPYQLEYGASFDTERGLGGILDISDHNTLGAARVIGLRSRYDTQLRELRAYFTQPSLLSWPVKTAFNAYTSREENPATSISRAFTIDRTGISGTQQRELRNHYVWTYGFRYERAHTFDAAAGRDELVNVAPLTSTFTRESRDNLLDASRGSFTSHAFSYSPSWLGADAPYVKYFGQYFRYFPLQPARRKPLTNEILRPRLIYAVAVRLGVARGLGVEIPASERFFAGGSTSLRGFEQNSVGPIGANSVAAGGAASLVINNELRFPLVSIFDGVAFADTGNVFSRAANFSLSDLRQTIGAGLRVRTKWFLVRGDYGIVLSPRTGEPRSRAYFSIGQAF